MKKTGLKKTRLYKPKPKVLGPGLDSSNATASTNTPAKTSKPEKPVLKKKDDKKKSNLELFKEELKVLQLEREQRHAAKQAKVISKDIANQDSALRLSRFEPLNEDFLATAVNNPNMLDDLMANSQNADPMTTNLFLGNVNPRMDEQQLCELFGKYGPLASVKVMWPRTDEERQRERNCAFVAYMTRRDADRALRHLQGRDVMGFEMKLGWGKTVPLPPHPVYVPQVLLERTMPPPPSGLPFNAQPFDPSKKGILRPEFKDKADFENTLKNSLVRVVVPTERNLLCIIHRMVEFVVREGPMFEAMIMNRELNNPVFRFLFDNQSPAHVYYRWRIFSVLQGESPDKYLTRDFRLFKNGSLWRPPPLNPYIDGLAETDSEDELPLHESAKVEETRTQVEPEKHKGELKEDDRDALEDILRTLLPRQKVIGEAMVFCLDHSDWAEEIVECITESMSILETPLTKKIARLYLISDILHNSSAKVANASFFRKHFEQQLEQVMCHLHACHSAISSRIRAEHFKQKVLACFRAWDDWAIYPDKYLIHLQNTFLGLVGANSGKAIKEEGAPVPKVATEIFEADEEVDGVQMGDDISLDENQAESDVDGVPLDADLIDGVPLDTSAIVKKEAQTPTRPRFVQSKWETVNPEDVESQAMTTSKWDLLENTNIDGEPLEEVTEEVYIDETITVSKEDEDGNEELKLSSEYDANKRARLREIELKVMKFQDEIESGQRERNPEMTIADQVDQYRTKLLERDLTRDGRKRSGRASEKKKEKKREKSSSSSSSSSGERLKKKRRRKTKDSTPNRKKRTKNFSRLGLVTYHDSDGSSDDVSSRRRASASSKKKKSSRVRSRSRDRHPGRSSRSAVRGISRSPKRSQLKRSRSRSRDKKRRRKNKH